MNPSRFFAAALALNALSACGSDNGSATSLHPLAYVVSECTANANEVLARQKLVVRQPSGEAITVKEFHNLGPVPPTPLCRIFGEARFGQSSVAALVFQRLGVSPDGSTVVFEITDDFSILSRNLVFAEEEGIFAVHADGTGLRRLGDASREASFRFTVDLSMPAGVDVIVFPLFSFSPDGRLVAFTDRPDGEETIQVMTLDVVTGERKQVTRLPPLQPPNDVMPPVRLPHFIDGDTIRFEKLTAEGFWIHLVETAGKGELRTEPPPPEAIPGSVLVPEPFITGPVKSLPVFGRSGTPMNQAPGFGHEGVVELFASDGENLLQLTDFRRVDTGFERFLSWDRQRVLFTASADVNDPFIGTNPFENCQFFTIDTLGNDLRQVTNFGDGQHAEGGCIKFVPTGCNMHRISHELSTDTALFYSSCNPLGTNPNGGAIFAMQFDGSGMEQLTHTRPMTTAPDGTVTVELPGPAAYPAAFR